MKEKKKAGQSTKLKLAAASILLVTGFGINTVSAKPIEESGLEPIYHIYNNGEYLGAVSNNESLKAAAEEKIDHTQSAYEELNLQVDRRVNVIEEKVFASPISNDHEALDRVAEALPIKAAAFSLSVDGEAAVYVKDREAYNETIKQVKLAFVSPEELAEWEERLETGKAPADIGVGETRLMDLAIAQKISGASQQVDPSAVMTVDQAVSYLLKGERFHRAASGESAQLIAEEFDMTVEDLKKMNPNLNLAAFEVGTSIKVAEEGPKVTVQVQREEKTAKAIANKTITKKDKNVLIGEKKVKKKGELGNGMSPTPSGKRMDSGPGVRCQQKAWRKIQLTALSWKARSHCRVSGPENLLGLLKAAISQAAEANVGDACIMASTLPAQTDLRLKAPTTA
ncbi:hypothetical protein NCCP2050_18340 [Planococcus sp. NCCP-2050]|nr:LysM domain-containing protein [Planococcus sp. NCCP-2050]GKW46142.1 hypothetical protein NCCP2050_18340 [Planococcus sp. NCCP-2050]